VFTGFEAGACAVMGGCLLLVAWRDVVTRTIPDALSIVIAGLGVTLRATAGGGPLLTSTATGVAVFLLLLPLAARGLLGGGDVKLAAAVALGLPPTAVWDFIFATVLAGGVLGLAYLAGPALAPRMRPAAGAGPLARILAVEAWRMRRRGPLPYGVAIAMGAILVLLRTPGS